MCNNTNLANRADCQWRADWNGYFCPPSEDNYVQLQIDDLSGKPNRTAANGTTFTYPYGYRLYHTKYIQLGIP
jgi:hypothetical protein